MSDEITNGNNLVFNDSTRQVYMVYELIGILSNTSKTAIADTERMLLNIQSSYNRKLFRLKSKLRKSKDLWIKYKLSKKIISSRKIHDMLVSDLNSTLAKERGNLARIRFELDGFKEISIEAQVSNDPFVNETYDTSYFFTSFVNIDRDPESEPRFWHENSFLSEILSMYNSGIPFAKITEWTLFDTISVSYNEYKGNNHVNI